MHLTYDYKLVTKIYILCIDIFLLETGISNKLIESYFIMRMFNCESQP